MIVVKEKMRKVEEIVKDYLMYLDVVYEFIDWFYLVKEEFYWWLDMFGDLLVMQKKLLKIKELIDFREIGVSCFSRVELLVFEVKQNIIVSGCEFMYMEMQVLCVDWKQWEDSVF